MSKMFELIPSVKPLIQQTGYLNCKTVSDISYHYLKIFQVNSLCETTFTAAAVFKQ